MSKSKFGDKAREPRGSTSLIRMDPGRVAGAVSFNRLSFALAQKRTATTKIDSIEKRYRKLRDNRSHVLGERDRQLVV
jgi:hypothetical protein